MYNQSFINKYLYIYASPSVSVALRRFATDRCKVPQVDSSYAALFLTSFYFS